MSANDSDFSSFWSHGVTRTKLASSSALSVGKHVAEDPLGDAERNHITEQVGYIIFQHAE